MTITPINQDLEVYTYTDFTVPIQVANGDDTLADLSGKTFILQGRLNASANSYFISLTTENGGIIVEDRTFDGEVFNLHLFYAHADTKQMLPAIGTYTMLMKDTATDIVDPIMVGVMRVKDSAAKP